MKNDNYIIVAGFMINELHLTGNDLLVYALIYGFSQDGETLYTGGRGYISKTLDISTRTVSRILDNLETAGLIEKYTDDYNGVKLNKYRVTNCQGGGQNVTGGYDKMSRGGDKMSQGYDKMSHNNTNNNTNNIKRGFVKPTLAEVKDYCRERNNNIDAETFIDYYESNGWLVGKNKMKDWRACVRTWEKKNFRTSENKTNNNRFNDFPQREYDESEIERRALMRRL